MTLRGEILGHLGKDEIKSFLDSPSIMSYWKILRALAFLVFITLYWLFYKISSGILYGMKIAMPSTRSFFETYFESGFWTLCIYILVSYHIQLGTQNLYHTKYILTNICLKLIYHNAGNQSNQNQYRW